jgi:hypothetical protein
MRVLVRGNFLCSVAEASGDYLAFIDLSEDAHSSAVRSNEAAGEALFQSCERRDNEDSTIVSEPIIIPAVTFAT